MFKECDKWATLNYIKYVKVTQCRQCVWDTVFSIVALMVAATNQYSFLYIGMVRCAIMVYGGIKADDATKGRTKVCLCLINRKIIIIMPAIDELVEKMPMNYNRNG